MNRSTSSGRTVRGPDHRARGRGARLARRDRGAIGAQRCRPAAEGLEMRDQPLTSLDDSHALGENGEDLAGLHVRRISRSARARVTPSRVPGGRTGPSLRLTRWRRCTSGRTSSLPADRANRLPYPRRGSGPAVRRLSEGELGSEVIRGPRRAVTWRLVVEGPSSPETGTSRVLPSAGVPAAQLVNNQ
jgi:hypothetical protein